MIYFFKNIINEETFAVESEKEASSLFKRNDFRDKFDFLGKSDGATFKQVLNEGTNLSSKERLLLSIPDDKLTPEQMQDKIALEERVSNLQALRDRAFKAELEVAINNPDKTKPQFKSSYGLDGNQQQNNAIQQTINMMK